MAYFLHRLQSLEGGLITHTLGLTFIPSSSGQRYMYTSASMLHCVVLGRIFVAQLAVGLFHYRMCLDREEGIYLGRVWEINIE